jgi:hypothetical protein
MQRLDDLGVKLSVLGVEFEPLDVPVDKSKSRNKVCVALYHLHV